LGAENSWTCTAAHSLGLALRAQARLDEAEPLLHEAADGRRKVLGPDHPRTLNSVTAYASLLADTARFADAERELLQSAQDAHLEDGPAPPGQMILVRTIAQVYEMWDKAEPDSGHAAQAASWRAKESAN
jgi:hypothetical protein